MIQPPLSTRTTRTRTPTPVFSLDAMLVPSQKIRGVLSRTANKRRRLPQGDSYGSGGRRASSALMTPPRARSGRRNPWGGPRSSGGEPTPAPVRSIARNQVGPAGTAALLASRLADRGTVTPPQNRTGEPPNVRSNWLG